jgi:polyisoprenyl-phosphate glycosyltransferase
VTTTTPRIGASRLWVVCPLLRDTESFVRLRDELAASCLDAGLAAPYRYVVVDDSAGTDPEVGRLGACPDVTVLTTPFNLGHQRAIVFGLRFTAPEVLPDDVVVTMDSDGQDLPADVPRLVDALVSGPTALALAVRTKRREPISFRLMYLCFRVMFRVLTGTTVRSGNLAAQRGASLVATIDHPSFDLCYSSTLLALRRPTTTVPCARGDRFAGTSRMSRYALVAHGVRMLLPFSEPIAVRMLVVAAASFATLAAFLGLVGAGVFGDLSTPVTLAPAIGLAVVFLAAFTAFVVLFSGFGQASAIAMKGIVVPVVEDRTTGVRNARASGHA